MDKEYKVKVSSQVDATVGLSLANRNFKREWTKRGQAMSIPFEIIEEAIFDNGFKNMLD